MGNAGCRMPGLVVSEHVPGWSVAVVVLSGRRLLYHCRLDKRVGFRENVDVVRQNAVSNRHEFLPKSQIMSRVPHICAVIPVDFAADVQRNGDNSTDYGITGPTTATISKYQSNIVLRVTHRYWPRSTHIIATK